MRCGGNGWFPLAVKQVGRETSMVVRCIPVHEFQDPFVESTIERVSGDEKELQFELDISMDVDSERLRCISPIGIVYHVSSCGSTLISQLLKCAQGVAVYSQPDIVSQVLLPPHTRERATMIKMLRGIANAFSNHAGGNYIWKLESWNVCFADLLTEAFPFTPWVFSIRDPIDVGISVINTSDPPLWFKLFGSATNPFAPCVTSHGAFEVSTARYFAAFYTAMCECVIKNNTRKSGIIVPYDTLPSAVWENVAPHFGVGLTSPDIEKMKRLSKIHYK